MCGQRGLSADSDNQTFGIALSRQFRTHYDTIIAPMQAEVSMNVHELNGQVLLAGGGANIGPFPGLGQGMGLGYRELLCHLSCPSVLCILVMTDRQHLPASTVCIHTVCFTAVAGSTAESSTYRTVLRICIHLLHREQRAKYVPTWDKEVCA